MMRQAPITTVILAGGLGSRIGGNKALQLMRGRPLVDWVFDSVHRQCDEVLISANTDTQAYAHMGCTMVADEVAGNAGPLAGLHAALSVARNDWVACVPCDTPFLPKDLIAKLYAAATAGDWEAAVAVVGGKRQPTLAIMRRSALTKLNDYLAAGERRVGGFLATLKLCEAEFDDAAAFVNINSRDDLKEYND